MRAIWESGQWRREKWEREPVSISLTTLFRPLLSRLDSAVKPVNSSVNYNHSQVSRASISRDANSAALSLPSPRAFFAFFHHYLGAWIALEQAT